MSTPPPGSFASCVEAATGLVLPPDLVLLDAGMTARLQPSDQRDLVNGFDSHLSKPIAGLRMRFETTSCCAILQPFACALKRGHTPTVS